jgi:hypothetical protein
MYDKYESPYHQGERESPRQSAIFAIGWIIAQPIPWVEVSRVLHVFALASCLHLASISSWYPRMMLQDDKNIFY